MRCIKILTGILLMMITGCGFGQNALSVNNPMGIVTPDTVVSGQLIYFYLSTHNTSTTTTYSGTITYVLGVDTSGTGGNVPANTDSIYNQTTAFDTILPNDSIGFNDSIPVIIGAGFKGGINTVVIWPVADFNTGFVTADSLKHNIFVGAATSLRKTEEQSALIIVPNPFGNKIMILSAPKNQPERVRIYSSLGALVYDDTSKQSIINTGGLLQGVYYIEILFQDGSQQIIKTIKE